MAPDSVVYLIDTKVPRLAPNPSLPEILKNMSLEYVVPASAKLPILGVYFEDSESKEFFESILSASQRRMIGKKSGVRLSCIALGVGGTNLVEFPGKDPLFASCVLVVDADTKVSKRAQARGNVVKLPSENDSSKGESPERTVFEFLGRMVNQEEDHHRKAIESLHMENASSDNVIAWFLSDSSLNIRDRDSAKKWWRRHWSELHSLRVVNVWASVYAERVTSFRDEFERAVSVAAGFRSKQFVSRNK